MKNHFKTPKKLILLATFSLAMFCTTLFTIPAPVSAHANITNFAAAPPPACDNNGASFFGFKPWYGYLHVAKNNQNQGCDVTDNFSLSNFLSPHSPIILILLAVIDDLLQLAGLIAIGYLIYGAIQYITSQGSSDGTAKAQSTIVNALIGLAIAITAVALVSFLGNKLGG